MISIASCFRRNLLVLAVAISTSGPVAAQEIVTSEPEGAENKNPPDSQSSDQADKLFEFTDKTTTDGKAAAEHNSGNELLDLRTSDVEYWDEATLDRYLEAVRAGLDYRIRGYEHRSRVFNWQLLSSRLIFVVVLLLVVGGMYFAWVQFHIGLQAQRERGERPEPTTLSASLKGVEVTSPILGVVILMISLLFFYLYLTYVYPIQEIL